MAYTTSGLTNGGVTTHYRFSYDQSLGGPSGIEPARTNAVIAACESDYNLMKGWFGNVSVTGMNVQVTTQSNGASWSGSASSSTIQLKAQGASYSNNSAYLRYLLIAEVVEIFMMAQNIGWFQGGDEGSKGEGLSRFLSGQFLAEKGFLGVGMDAAYAVADLWLNSPRIDFVNNAPDDNGDDSTNGCTTLFIYYLFSQLGFSIPQIVAAGAATLAGVYKHLTGDSSDPFPKFKAILDVWFPSQTSSAVAGPNFDNPFPLVAERFSGVWRGGNEPYYLWLNADQSHFISKWQTLAAQNLRLTDIEVTNLNGQTLFSGIWEGGTDGYYLWINADTSGFTAKWQALAAQSLRLVSIKHYNGLWAGVWRAGTDGYYLWIDADQASFVAKWQALAAQNLRLVDFEVYTVGGQTLWAGVWRAGTDGYYLWINASWASFTAKWQALAAQNLRLVAVRNYNGLWAGIWRSGSDPYYLWANVSETDFTNKWASLAGQNLRLVDLLVTPISSTGGVGSLGVGAAAVHAEGSSELTAHGGDASQILQLARTNGEAVGQSELKPRTSARPASGVVGHGGGTGESPLAVGGGTGSGELALADASLGTGGGEVTAAVGGSPGSGLGGGSVTLGEGGGTDTIAIASPMLGAGSGGGAVAGSHAKAQANGAVGGGSV